MKRNILIIVAHPDDELLGMGGTIQKLVKQGNSVNILLLSKTGNARANNEHSIRIKNFNKVIKKLKIDKSFFAEFPDTSFDSVGLLNIIKEIEKVLDIIKPEVVYTHFYNDLNIDHSLVSKALLTAIRPYSKFNFVKEVYLFEVAGTTDYAIGTEKFFPNIYEELTKQMLDLKKELLDYYETEIKNFPHPISKKSIENFAVKRGVEAGLDYAEAFILYRKINNYVGK